MIGIGIVFGVIGLGFLCCALFDLVVYALPAIVGIAVGIAAYYSGAGVLGAIIVTIVAGALTLVAGEAAIERARSAALRTIIALLFAVPAALIGYILTLGVAQLVYRRWCGSTYLRCSALLWPEPRLGNA